MVPQRVKTRCVWREAARHTALQADAEAVERILTGIEAKDQFEVTLNAHKAYAKTRPLSSPESGIPPSSDARGTAGADCMTHRKRSRSYVWSRCAVGVAKERLFWNAGLTVPAVGGWPIVFGRQVPLASDQKQ